MGTCGAEGVEVMSRTSQYRGHKTRWVRGEWQFVDIGDSIYNPRPCGRCGLDRTDDRNGDRNEYEGHDGCLGTLGDGVTEACCGHGTGKAYISYSNGSRLVDVDAMKRFKELGVGPDGYDDEEYKLRLRMRSVKS